MTCSTMQPNQHRWLARSASALALGLALLASAAAQSQDAGRALNLFQQLLQPKQNAAPAPVLPIPVNPAGPGNPAQQSNPAGLLGNALSGSNTNRNAANTAMAGDLIGLLSQSATQIDQPQEIEIGQQLSAVLLGSKPLHPDMQLQRYVNQLGRWISLQSARPDLPWTFAVLDDEGFNAFAAPGGYVFVTKGLDQDDEYEADRLGVALAAASGFDPYGLVAVLQQLRMATPDNPVFSLSISTHPPAQLRIDQMEWAMGNRLDALSGKPAISVSQRMEALATAQAPAQSAVPAATAVTGKPPAATRLPPKAAATAGAKPKKP